MIQATLNTKKIKILFYLFKSYLKTTTKKKQKKNKDIEDISE